MTEKGFAQSEMADSAYERILDEIRTARIIDIAQWFRDLLNTGRGGPFMVLPGRETATDVIMRLYRTFEDARVQFKMRRAVAILFRQAGWQVDSPFYLSELLAIIGYLNVTAVRRRIGALANRKELKRVITPTGGNLHQHLLNTIVALEDVPGAFAVFKRDIQQPEYASICYQGLWERRLDYGVEYLPAILTHQRKHPELVNLPFALDSFISQTEVDSKIDYFAKDLFPAALRLLEEPDEIQLFLDSLKSAGYVFESSRGVYWFRSPDGARLSEEYSQGKLPSVLHIARLLRGLEEQYTYSAEETTRAHLMGEGFELASAVLGEKQSQYLSFVYAEVLERCGHGNGSRSYRRPSEV
jgi:hypothetical protein